ncbi:MULTISPECIES: hypothetical protein [Pseudomonas syringae group]|uniref:hypothetical protein n=1 Tax=Pseudomonas syringae group TaxID=136849 RepID=UPI0013CF98B0|nr:MULTISPECIES: hypothetical protein [Pseudomonas syringae group]MDU8458157.1 hypothetical protein [Pseudomonas syringae group sp. J254-4]
MNRPKPLHQLISELLQFFTANGIGTSSSIAKATGINQSQVYRNLFAAPKKVTKTHLRLCKFANIDAREDTLDPRSSEILMEALATIWDGSDDHARRLADLLFAHSRASVGTCT